jgi:hypothetical protein
VIYVQLLTEGDGTSQAFSPDRFTITTKIASFIPSAQSQQTRRLFEAKAEVLTFSEPSKGQEPGLCARQPSCVFPAAPAFNRPHSLCSGN